MSNRALAVVLLCGMTAILFLLAAPVGAATAYPCSPTGSGPPDCTCVDWGAVFEIRCPGITDWRELGGTPNPNPNPNPGGGGSGAPTGNPPGESLANNELLEDSFKNAKLKALARGKLSPMLPKTHPDYEPTDCMELFAPYGPSMSNGKWIINQFIQYRWGEGVQANGGVPCNDGATSAWTLNAGSGYPYVFLCNQFKDLPLNEAAVILIHEALHVAGLKESPATPGKPTTHQIQNQVRQTCGL